MATTAQTGHIQNNGVDGEKGLAGSAGNPGSGNVHSANRRRIANPAPLGLISFASTTLLLSFVNVSARNVKEPQAAVGMALAVGGLCQFLAGMWEFAAGNTFGATAFSSYGGFWFSFAALLIPGTGIASALEADGNLDNGLALYLSTWLIFTFIMLIASLRSNLGLVLLFFFLDLTFLLLTIAHCFPAKTAINTAGGALGIITAFIAYYVGASELMPRHASFVTLPTYQLPKRDI